MKLKKSLSDKSLIEDIKLGNQKAISQAYKQNYQMVVRLIQKNNGQERDAKDIYQEAWIDTLEKIEAGKLDDLRSKLSTYLYQVCRFKWIDELRKKGRIPVSFIDTQEFTFKDFAEDPYDDEDPEFYQRGLATIWNQLSEKCQRILYFFYYQKESMVRIAEKLQLASADSAKAQKNKCMVRARDFAKHL